MTETHSGTDDACCRAEQALLSINCPDAINMYTWNMYTWKNEIKSLVFTTDKNKFQVHQTAIRDMQNL